LLIGAARSLVRVLPRHPPRQRHHHTAPSASAPNHARWRARFLVPDRTELDCLADQDTERKLDHEPGDYHHPHHCHDHITPHALAKFRAAAACEDCTKREQCRPPRTGVSAGTPKIGLTCPATNAD
jgi:hypothetical protein